MSDPVNEIMNSEEPPTIESNNNIVIEEQEPSVEEPSVPFRVTLASICFCDILLNGFIRPLMFLL